MKSQNAKFIAADVAECALMVALMCAAAYVQIPFPLVPLTFQTVISVLAGLLLGWKKGAISMAVYCFLGLVGVPVFTAGGGIFYVLKPSFGYILGFILAAAVAGLIANGKKPAFWRCVVAAMAAFLADYAAGIPYCLVAARLSGTENIVNLFLAGNLAYMPKDAVLCFIAAVVAFKVVPVICRRSAKFRGGKNGANS